MDLSSLFVEQIVAGRLAGWSLSGLAQRRSRERAPLQGGAYVLRNGRVLGAIGSATVGFVIGIWLVFRAIGVEVASKSEGAAVAFSVMGLIIGGFFVLGGFGGRTRLTVKGIEHRIFFLFTSCIEWAEVSTVHFDARRPHEINITSKSEHLIISMAMKGSGTLAEQILERVPASILDINPETHARLVQIRAKLPFEKAPLKQRE